MYSYREGLRLVDSNRQGQEEGQREMQVRKQHEQARVMWQGAIIGEQK